MIEIERQLHTIASRYLGSRRVLVLLGPRGAGKSHLLRLWADEREYEALFLNGEDLRVQELLDPANSGRFMTMLGSSRFFILDEARKIPDITETVLRLLDDAEAVKIILAASSSDAFGDDPDDPLRGQKYTFHLFPLAEKELPPGDQGAPLMERLIYGCYPALFSLTGQKEKEDYLRSVVNDCIYKDIPAAEGIRVSEKIGRLMLLLAERTGNELSMNELGKELSISKNTAEKYLEVLSRLFIIHPVAPYAEEGKRHLAGQRRWYFLDNGLRNSLLNNFSAADKRDDIYILWENYLISQRIKQQRNQRRAVTNYFLRTYDGLSIPWLEDSGGKLTGYKFTLRSAKKKSPAAWHKALPQASFRVITPSNYKEWLVE